MSNKLKLNNRVKTYSIIASAFIPSVTSATVHTATINHPMSDGAININFENAGGASNDGDDIRFWLRGANTLEVAHYNNENVYFIGRVKSTIYFEPRALTQNNSIAINPSTPGYDWGRKADRGATAAYPGGWGFDGTTDNYLGVKFEIGGNTHYGWVRLNVGNSPYNTASTIIVSYGYEDIPDTPISSPLPVELTMFTADIFEGNVKLTWETASEINNYGFEIERASVLTSTTREWQNIGFVPGQGNSNSVKFYEFSDENPPEGLLEYRLKQIDTDGSFEYFMLTAKIDNTITDINAESIPGEYSLKQNFPNPFNPSTVINYQLPESRHVILKVFDALGNEISTLVNRKINAGYHSVNFNAENLGSGIYFYQLSTKGFVKTKKMMVLK